MLLDVKFIAFTLLLQVPIKLMIVYVMSQQTCHWLPVFVKKVLLENRNAYSVTYYDCFCATMGYLNCW